jgi:hypothetical protein
MNLDEQMNQFRLTSRELYNRSFRMHESNDGSPWVGVERFREVQEVLFLKLVTEPVGLQKIRYGDVHAEISVELRDGVEAAPVMLNRDVDSGYWDHPLLEIPRATELVFVSFFDWDQLSYLDNLYTRVQVVDWPANREANGKHALIESQYVRFAKADGL